MSDTNVSGIGARISERREPRRAAGALPLANAADPRTTAAERRRRRDKLLRWILPLSVVASVLIGWHLIVVLNDIPFYILPGPIRVFETVWSDWDTLGPSLYNTLYITVLSLVIVTLVSLFIAICFAQSRIVEYSFFPIAVVIQVTPIIAVFPLINIYMDSALAKLLLCGGIVAFFPLLQNTTVGLNSADRNLKDLFRLYGASRWQSLRFLQMPSAMPMFLAALRISGGLALIGAVVGEFVLGRTGVDSTGLASRIIESAYRGQIPRTFAAIVLICIAGIVIYVTLTVISNLILRKWHESAMKGGGR